VAEAYAIDPSKLNAKPPLATFHARDVLAPAAAALACGVEPRALGVPVSPGALVAAPFGRPRAEGDTVVTEVLDVDRFGSLRLGVMAEQLEEFGLVTGQLELSLGHLSMKVALGRTYSDVGAGDPVALVDSSGLLTLSVRLDSAAERYGVEVGAPVRIRPMS
jgi:S-adenosylmethionine hydrolase